MTACKQFPAFLSAKKIFLPSLLFLVMLLFSDLNRASAATGVTLSGAPATVSAGVGGTFTVTVKADTNGDEVSAAELHFSYDQTALQGQSITAGSGLPVVLTPGTIGSGVAAITLGANPNSPLTGTGSVATLTFKALKTGTSNVNLTGSQTASIGKTGNTAAAFNGTAVTVGLGATAPATNKPAPTPAPPLTPNIVSLSILPATLATAVGNTVSLSLNLDAGGDKVTAAELHLKFDPAKLQAQSVTAGSFMSLVLTPGSVDNADGTAAIILGSGPGVPVAGNGTLATINFKALSPGLAVVEYDITTQTASLGKSGNSASSLSGSDLMIYAQNVPSPKPTPASTPASGRGYRPAIFNISNITQGALVLRSTLRHDSMVRLKANAKDEKEIKRVLFFVNGIYKCKVTQAPFECNWRVPKTGRSPIYTISVEATDISGNTSADNITVRAK